MVTDSAQMVSRCHLSGVEMTSCEGKVSAAGGMCHIAMGASLPLLEDGRECQGYGIMGLDRGWRCQCSVINWNQMRPSVMERKREKVPPSSTDGFAILPYGSNLCTYDDMFGRQRTEIELVLNSTTQA